MPEPAHGGSQIPVCMLVDILHEIREHRSERVLEITQENAFPNLKMNLPFSLFIVPSHNEELAKMYV
jgi:hypothetical protein